MFKSVTENDLKILSQLKKNNDREWFHKHKPKIEIAQKNFLDLVSGLIFVLSEFDESVSNVEPKSAIFRIYRDVRYAHDKSPYKAHLAAFISVGGRLSDTEPGYYFHFAPHGASLFGAGLYMSQKNTLRNVRTEIAHPQSRIVQMLADKVFRKSFPVLDEDLKLKRVPRGFDANHPQCELLKLRHHFVYTQLADKVVTSKNLLNTLAKGAEPLSRWCAVLRQATRG
ncbi:MAG TPA: DUF2461 domain-containing protein [Turneriella sp.]|nr:DUF2461 domain-containing protein [Turneriella sp.]